MTAPDAPARLNVADGGPLDLLLTRRSGSAKAMTAPGPDAAQLDTILSEGPEQERMEAWIVNEVNNGAALPGLYPMNAETKARYAASKK